MDVFKHFYDDSIYQSGTTHYVNLAYEIEIEEYLIYLLDSTMSTIGSPLMKY